MNEFNVEEFEVVDVGAAGEETKQLAPGNQPDSVFVPKGRVSG